ncbi:MAG: hypothetical protein ACLFUX_10435, partial [Spirochaetaceae bacterium]
MREAKAEEGRREVGSRCIGSVHLVVNTATDDVAQELIYDAFGRVLSDTAPGFQPFGFAGASTIRTRARGPPAQRGNFGFLRGRT